VGGFFSFLIASLIVERAGAKAVCILGLPMLATASFAFASASTLPLAIIALLLFGMSFSVVNVAMNVEADRIEVALGRRIMSRCHGFWSLGFLATALAGVAATGFGLSAGVHLGLVVPIVVAGVTFAVVPLAESAPRRHSGKPEKSMMTWPSLATLGIVCFGLLGSIVQGGTQNWSVIYMRESFEVPDWMDALTIPAFLLALTFGRLSGDRWLDHYGTLRVGFGLVSTALLGLIIVVTSGFFWGALAGFALMGLGVSIIFPLMVTAAAALGDRAASANVAAVTMTTGIGMLVVPPIMGFMADNYGIRAAFAALLPAFLLAYLTLRQVVPKGSD
jgi:MFS family permease